MTVPYTGRYLFVAGLHRSGTSLLARMIGEHPEVSQISGSPAPEDEGCYLQGGIPHTALDGRPGHYATNVEEHLVESCRYDRLDVRDRIAADWDNWFQPERKWRIEKSPVNLVRTRLYQQLFPMAQFIVIMRHPAMLAAATAKWSDKSFPELVDYALGAYDVLLGDLPYLHSALLIRYEDLVARPAAHRAAIFAFMSLETCSTSIALRDGNTDYPQVPDLSPQQAQRCAMLGYGPGGDRRSNFPQVRHPLRAVREATEAALKL